MFESCRLSAFITVWPLTVSTTSLKSGDLTMTLGVASSLSLQQIEVIILIYRLTQLFVCGWSQHKIDCWFTDISRDRRLNKQQPLSQVVYAAQLSITISVGAIKCHFHSKKQTSAATGPQLDFFSAHETRVTKLAISNSYRYCCLDSDSTIWNVNNLE